MQTRDRLDAQGARGEEDKGNVETAPGGEGRADAAGRERDQAALPVLGGEAEGRSKRGRAGREGDGDAALHGAGPHEGRVGDPVADEGEGVSVVPQPAQDGSPHGQAEEVKPHRCSYAQAHLVQKQIADMEKAEKEKWMGNRVSKI